MTCEKCDDTGVIEGRGEDWYTAAGEHVYGWKDPDTICDCPAALALFPRWTQEDLDRAKELAKELREVLFVKEPEQ